LHYTNNTGRNDIITSKVAVDRNTVYFYVETREGLTPHTGTNWMLLLIDADLNPDTGWFGYDYLINQRIVDGEKTSIMRYASDGADGRWTDAKPLKYRYSGNALKL